jgi:HD-GYP domain-containing protein (c-di-GMP phosphodiesterase class II)/anti-sigma regulatory factor (Ser/Thr protein kinase)
MTKLNIYVFIINFVGVTSSIFMFNISDLKSVSDLAVLGLVGILFIIRVELFYERYYQGSSIIVFVTYFLYGLTDALIIIGIISLFESLYYKSGIKKGLFNFSLDALGMILSSFVYQWLGGTIVNELDFNNLINIVVVLGIYHILNLFILSGVFQIIQKGSYIKLIKEMAQNFLLFVGITTLLSLYLVFNHAKDMFNMTLDLLFLYTILLVVRYIFQHYIKLRKSHISMVESLTQMTDQKTHQDQHAARVGWIAKQIGTAIKLPPEQLDQLYYAAMFHDIGKTSINEKIFQKKGPLTLDEQKDYESHVRLGYEWLNKIEGYHPIADIVLHHHEQWDGGGFPDALSGTHIPYLSRIIAIANKLDHLLRENKSAALKNLKKMAGIQLDPELVAVTVQLTTILERYEDSQEITEWMKMSNYVSDVRQKIYNSELLNHFGVNLIVNYENGGFYNHSNQQAVVPCSSEVTLLAERSIQEGQPVRHNLQDHTTGTIYDVYCLPVGRTANILLFDVTRVIRYEKEQEIKMKKIYKDVIYAVTQAKMLLVEADELDEHLKGTLGVSHEILVPTDISKCRHIIDGLISESITDSKKKYQVLLCINECLTNVLKHAQKGQMKTYTDDGRFRILIQDNGSGIDLADLPKSTLMQGYSTKLSLGQGFKLMMNYSDRLVLCTNSSGTSILLEFETNHSMIASTNGLYLQKEEGMKYA